MKTFFSLVLINLIIFGYSLPAYLTDERTKKSYERAKNLHSALRYLDEVVERVGSNEEAPTNAPSDNKTEPLPDIPDIKPSGGERSKPKQNTQILTFGNYAAEKTDKSAQTSTIIVTYTIVIVFTDRDRPPTIITITIRLRIKKPKKLVRNLAGDDDEFIEEDVPTNCTLKQGNDGTGVYDCAGETKNEGSEAEGAEVNSKVPMVADGTPLDMSDVGFSEAAAEIGKNLHNSTIKIDSSATPYTLKAGKIEDQTKTSFKVRGTIKDFQHKQGDKFNFTFFNQTDENNGENIYVECTVDSKEGDDVVFKCPVNKRLDAIIDGAIGNSITPPPASVTFNFTEGEIRKIELKGSSSGGNGGNNGYYRKNSSGLSGGAIAGIVIASAVALIVASVVAMMFRKSKPIENVSSTNVELNAPERF